MIAEIGPDRTKLARHREGRGRDAESIGPSTGPGSLSPRAIRHPGPMRFSEAELTAAIAGVAKATLAAQSKEIRKGRVDVEQAWQDLGGYGRYQLLEPIGAQIMPILASLPDVPRVAGERPSFSAAQLRDAVEQHTGDEGGRMRRKAMVMARTALVRTALASMPPWSDPEEFVVPDSF